MHLILDDTYVLVAVLLTALGSCGLAVYHDRKKRARLSAEGEIKNEHIA